MSDFVSFKQWKDYRSFCSRLLASIVIKRMQHRICVVSLLVTRALCMRGSLSADLALFNNRITRARCPADDPMINSELDTADTFQFYLDKTCSYMTNILRFYFDVRAAYPSLFQTQTPPILLSKLPFVNSDSEFRYLFNLIRTFFLVYQSCSNSCAISNWLQH